MTENYNITNQYHWGIRYFIVKDVEVMLDCGLCAGTGLKIVEECKKYSVDIRLSDGKRTAFGRGIIGLMTLEALKGKKLDILVEDVPGHNSEEIARRLYNGLTTEGFDPIFDRRE